MQIGSDTRESAFQDISYVDDVLKIEIHGGTVNDINKAADALGLTAAQWIRVTIATELLRCQDRRCEDPDCPDAWAEHPRHS